ncbi:Tn3 family transposase [Niveibacterium sp. SC-1]|uniref:Tn3 family transposase n=1 Tax=Niveibacterium sp. SC-1 TaxID=3135646 RepID=UPI00311FB46A
MASLERTAYPQFLGSYDRRDLQAFFVVSDAEREWSRTAAKAPAQRLALVVLLKAFQHVRYFPSPHAVPSEVAEFIRDQLGYGTGVRFTFATGRTLIRYKAAVLKCLRIKPFRGPDAQRAIERLATEAANLMVQRNDVINAMIEGLILTGYELPAFSTLNNTAEAVHVAVQNRLFDSVVGRMPAAQIQEFNALLETDKFERGQSEYNALKKSAKRPTRKHLELLVDHLEWLESMAAVEPLFKGLPDTKIRHFAEQAMAYDVSELKECVENKRYTLIAALILRMKVRARDQLAEMFLRRVATIHKRAKEELETLQAAQRSQVEDLIGTLDDVLAILEVESDDAAAGKRIRACLKPAGGAQRLRETCAQVKAMSGSNYLPLVWKHFKSHRSILFRLTHLLDIRPTSQDTALLDALELIKRHQDKHRVEWIEDAGDISFASERWRKLLREGSGDAPGVGVNRRHLEICVFSYVAEELRSGDLSIAGTEAFADYRDQLLSWEECEALLPAYCEKMGFANSAEHFVSDLRSWLTTTAQTLDDKFPECRGDVVLGPAGEPVLRKTVAREIPPSAISLQNTLAGRMPSRHILDVLANIEHWMNFTRHFGPLSGHAAKLKQPAERYLLTIFAMGCNLGPSQAARHLVASGVTPHMLSFVNRRHLSLEMLEKAQRELNEVYLQLDLPKIWGDGKTVAADGTQYDFYDENLLAGYHFRYRKMGAVAYRHVANNYIAVFRHFIPPGVWEAIYVIEGLLNAGLSVEADTVHADTQGQSATVFAFTHLLGIKLMPRIRNWKHLTLYRPDKTVRYAHINRLFTDTVDWSLIERHWRDLMQVALSIHAGRISSATLLRKLGSYSRKNRLYFAAQELGNVIRTGFLLEWIGSRELRQEITANTNKIESYNGFAKWLSFGGDVIAVNEPEEQQKRLRYNDLVASALILQNAVDMTRALRGLRRDGWEITDDDVSFLSPYQVAHIKRFGDYSLKLRRAHEAWIRDETFQQAAAAVLKARRVPEA